MLRNLLTALLALAIAVPAVAKDKSTGTVPDGLSARDWAERCDRPDGRQDVDRWLADCRRIRCFSGVRTAADARAILRCGDSASACDRARSQLLAASLNHASGRRSNDRCGDWDAYLRHCGGGAHDCAHHGGGGHHDHDDHDHDGCDRHENQHGKGHQKAKGKGHSKD